MPDRTKDALVEETVFGRVPCLGWKPFNFGSAGGLALRKDCDHDLDRCYPVIETSAGGYKDGIGGPPRYTASMDRVREMLTYIGQHRDPCWVYELIELVEDALRAAGGVARMLVYAPESVPETIVDVVLAQAARDADDQRT